MTSVRASILGAIVVVSSLGSAGAQWIENGTAICTAVGNQAGPRMAAALSGDAIVAWHDYRNGNADVYAQRIDYVGRIYWDYDGVPICVASGNQLNPQLVPDGADGAIMCWEHSRSGVNDVYAQRVDASGAIRWADNGVAVCTAPEDQYVPQIVSDNQGGAIITWVDYRSGTADVYAQRLSASGAPLWTADGIAVCAVTGDQYQPQIVSDGAGGAVIVWIDNRSGGNDIFARRITAGGGLEWVDGGVAICATSDDQWYPRIASDGAGGAIITWRDKRSGFYDIYTQRIASNGILQWNANGVPVCAAPNGQYSAQVIQDGSGGAIVAWDDERAGNWDIYAQRISPSGRMLWAADGVPLCTAPDAQNFPQLASDMAGGAIVAWRDRRNANYDIYAQRIEPDGATEWAGNGVSLCRDATTQWNAQVASDGTGGAIIAWEGYRGEYTDIFAMRVNAEGEKSATLLQYFDARVEGGDVVISWTLSEAGDFMRFFVMRSEGSSAYEELEEPEIEGNVLAFACRDRSAAPGRSYRYRVDVEDEAGRRMLFETGAIELPAVAATLYQNYPNPFNPSTVIRFHLPVQCQARLAIFDAAGHLVETLVDSRMERGAHEIAWRGRLANGAAAPAGVYFCVLRAGKISLTRKMVLAR